MLYVHHCQTSAIKSSKFLLFYLLSQAAVCFSISGKEFWARSSKKTSRALWIWLRINCAVPPHCRARFSIFLHPYSARLLRSHISFLIFIHGYNFGIITIIVIKPIPSQHSSLSSSITLLIKLSGTMVFACCIIIIFHVKFNVTLILFNVSVRKCILV